MSLEFFPDSPDFFDLVRADFANILTDVEPLEDHEIYHAAFYLEQLISTADFKTIDEISDRQSFDEDDPDDFEDDEPDYVGMVFPFRSSTTTSLFWPYKTLLQNLKVVRVIEYTANQSAGTGHPLSEIQQAVARLNTQGQFLEAAAILEERIAHYEAQRDLTDDEAVELYSDARLQNSVVGDVGKVVDSIEKSMALQVDAEELSRELIYSADDWCERGCENGLPFELSVAIGTAMRALENGRDTDELALEAYSTRAWAEAEMGGILKADNSDSDTINAAVAFPFFHDCITSLSIYQSVADLDKHRKAIGDSLTMSVLAWQALIALDDDKKRCYDYQTGAMLVSSMIWRSFDKENNVGAWADAHILAGNMAYDFALLVPGTDPLKKAIEHFEQLLEEWGRLDETHIWRGQIGLAKSLVLLCERRTSEENLSHANLCVEKAQSLFERDEEKQACIADLKERLTRLEMAVKS